MRGLGLVVAAVLMWGCGSESANGQGEIGGNCYPNGTCNVSLNCIGGVCSASESDAGADSTPATCGNGVVEISEDCDEGPIDGNATCDATCHFTCGNGIVNTVFGETCDTAITAGIGKCLTSCDDGQACTTDAIIGPPCSVSCSNTTVTLPVNGDGCCPIGADGNTDDDCSPLCNVLNQAGCQISEKCTWINDQDNPPIGHIGCAPDGGIALGGACTAPPGGPTGYDTCVEGTLCVLGKCKAICAPNGGVPTCDVNHNCEIYSGLLESGGVSVAGVCDSSCDPLTQELKSPAAPACGSPTAAMPIKGCYGTDSFRCHPAGMSVYPLTDRQLPRTNAAGTPYVNGCAPGYMPLIVEATGSTTIMCAGLCAALETDNTAPHVNNAKGDSTASAKLVQSAASAVGNATCDSTKKGSEATSVCKFMWPTVQKTNGTFATSFTPYLNSLGYCVALAHYNYDHDGIPGTPNVPFPNCNTLPPRSAATPLAYDDAADWGCQLFVNSMLLAPPMRDFAVRSRGHLPLKRHSFD